MRDVWRWQKLWKSLKQETNGEDEQRLVLEFKTFFCKALWGHNMFKGYFQTQIRPFAFHSPFA